jgi:1-aminocyclopropane-1-carboxylate deaminase
LNFHFGGYAKITKNLVSFIQNFEKINKITLDAIYTGKVMYALDFMIGNGIFKEDSIVIVLHTGGLQGNDGMKNNMDKLLS